MKCNFILNYMECPRMIVICISRFTSVSMFDHVSTTERVYHTKYDVSFSYVMMSIHADEIMYPTD